MHSLGIASRSFAGHECVYLITRSLLPLLVLLISGALYALCVAFHRVHMRRTDDAEEEAVEEHTTT